MATRMTAPRLGRLVADGDADAVRAALAENPALLARTVEREGQGGWTPLHLAVVARQAEIVRLLVGAGADLTARTEHSRTPLHVALEQAPDLVPLLRDAGAQLDAASAAFLDDVAELTRCLDDGASLVDPGGGPDLLSWAAAGGAVGATRLLLDRGANVDGGALHAAARRGHPELVALLLGAGADVDRRDPDTGRAPLHEAVAGSADGQAPDVVRALLAAGADVDATTSDGASALDISRVAAARHRRADAGQATVHDTVAQLLVTHGATG